MYVIWPVSVFLLSVFVSQHHRRVRDTTRREEANKLKVADYIDQQLAGRLRPLEGALVSEQAGFTELSKKVVLLDGELDEFAPYFDDLRKEVWNSTKVVESISKDHRIEAEQYREAMARYHKWYDQRGEASRALEEMIKGAQSTLEKLALLSDQVDELLDSFGATGRESPVSGTTGPSEAGGGPQAQGVGQVLSNQTTVKETPLPAGGKLTKEKGIANRERGIKAQLQFYETLRAAGKTLDNSIKEGTPDFVFYTPDTRIARGVGAFKALTLRDDENRQRWIPRRKVLAEQRMALKLGVRLVLFVQNYANGRIWAKVIPVAELRGFDGLTTPVMLVENDPTSEKACKDTLDMALQLL